MGAAVGPQLYRILRRRIIRNDLVPEVRMSESEIAGNYGVSRQPVREAFIKLSEEGLLEIRPQRGTFVRRIVISEVTGARFVREAIEADVIKLLASEHVLGLVEELRAQLRRQKSVAERKEPYSRFVELDDTFHRTLATAARQNYAWEIVENVKAQMDRVRHLSALRFPMEKLIAQHEAIVDAIEAQDVQAAEAAIRGHLREILNDLPVVAQSRPEFFDDTE